MLIRSNKAKCLKCDDVIISMHRHDYNTCSCGNLSVDGGLDYLKRNYRDVDNVEELSEIDYYDERENLQMENR